MKDTQEESSKLALISVKVISQNWFEQINNYLSSNSYIHILNQPTRLFNGEETSFMVCPKTKDILAARGIQNVYEIEQGSVKSSVTVLFTFNANGVRTRPTMVYPHKRLPSSIGRSVTEDWGIGVTSSGWINSKLFCKHSKKILFPHFKIENITFPVIPLLNGHGSHVNSNQTSCRIGNHSYLLIP